MTDSFWEALAAGDVPRVAALILAGVDLRAMGENGYDVLTSATFGRDVLRDPQLIPLLELLIAGGAALTGMSAYGESAVRVLSRIGRFDAVRLLLDAGANPKDVRLTPLIAAVAFGTRADMEAVLETGPDLEARDWWERTAWLVAVQTGDIARAQTLQQHGARTDARGRCGKPPLFYAIENGHLSMLRWLLESGQDVGQTDDFGSTALQEAADSDDPAAVEVLLAAGADVNRPASTGTALSHAEGQEVARRLLAAGADPQELSTEARRAMLGLASDPEFLKMPLEDFRKWRVRRFGQHNPEAMGNPFWEGMVRSGLNAYQAAAPFGEIGDGSAHFQPTWCADRFGQSLTFLPDGRIVQIAGEHEDSYDPDFCIYNDVFVHGAGGSLTIFGYPDAVFPPTDFHTATLLDGFIYLIGSLGYPGTRRFGHTSVYRLDTQAFRMERLETTGDGPGWIYKHRAVLADPQEIWITGGTIATVSGDREEHAQNTMSFLLDVETRVWRVAASGS